MDLVFFGKDRLFSGPINSEIRIVPDDPTLIFGRVVLGTFIQKFG